MHPTTKLESPGPALLFQTHTSPALHPHTQLSHHTPVQAQCM